MISAVKRSRTEIIIEFIRKNTVCAIAFAAALITGFIVPPDAQYLGYFDLKTLIYDERNVKTPVVIPTKKDKIKVNLLKEGPIDLETEIMEIVF